MAMVWTIGISAVGYDPNQQWKQWNQSAFFLNFQADMAGDVI